MRLPPHSLGQGRCRLLVALALQATTGCLDWDTLYGPPSTDPLALWDFELPPGQRTASIDDKAKRPPDVALTADVPRGTSTNIAIEAGALRLGGGRVRPPFRPGAELAQALAEGPGFSFEGWLEIPARRTGVIMLIGPNGRGGVGHLSAWVESHEEENQDDELHVSVRVLGPATDAGTRPASTHQLNVGIARSAPTATRPLHLAVTHSKEAGVMSVYFDGAQVRQWSSRDEEKTVAIWDPAYIGDWVLSFGADGAYNGSWTGKIGFFAFYDRALGADEIAASFARGPAR